MRRSFLEAVDGVKKQFGVSFTADAKGKGDDLFDTVLDTVLEALLLFRAALQLVGVGTNAGKTVPGKGIAELERCFADEHGLHHSLARRIGNAIVAEPQTSASGSLDSIFSSTVYLR